MGGFALVGVLECRGSSRRAPRGCSALSATFPCVTLTPSGAQTGAMPTSGELLKAATNGALEEVQMLIENRANIDEKDKVRDGAGRRCGSSVAKVILMWYAILNMVQGCCECLLRAKAKLGIGYLSCIYVDGRLKSSTSGHFCECERSWHHKDTFGRLIE